MAKLLGIDVGTSGCKVLLIDEKGRTLAKASAEYPLSIPQPMWSEQNPQDWWEGVQQCLTEIGEPNPDAIGLSGQMHGAVFLDEHDEVLRPAILWNDQRTIAEAAWIEKTVGPTRLREITCNPALTGFQAPKIAWLRNREPDAFSRIRKILLPKDFIRLKLSGAKASEVSDASGTGLFDVPRRIWSHELMDKLEFDRAWFPDVFESDVVSTRTRSAPGLADDIPIVGGGGDQAAGATGTGAVLPGVVSVSLGTSGVVFASIPTPQYEFGGATHTFCHANRSWHAMGVMLSCGGALRWYRDATGPRGYDAIAEEAKACLTPSGPTFLPYLAGERSPHNDPRARAAFAGLTLAHGRPELSRSVFQGISFGLADSMDLIRALGSPVDVIRVTGGGARSHYWVQLLADCFNAPCEILESDEGPALGAAILAGVGIGVFGGVADGARAAVRVKAEVATSGADYTEARIKYKAAYASLAEWNKTDEQGA